MFRRTSKRGFVAFYGHRRPWMVPDPGSSQVASKQVMMRRDSWPLLALSFAQERRLTPVQVQKALFLVGQYVIDDDRDYYHFEPYHYGPFDSSIYSDLDNLAELGLVAKVESDQFRGFEYVLTPAGECVARHKRRSLTPPQQTYLADAIPWVRSRTFRQLVSAIYKAFPWTAQNSIFKH